MYLFRYEGSIFPFNNAPTILRPEYSVEFRSNDKKYVLVSDFEDGSLGRLCNHSLQNANMKLVVSNEKNSNMILFFQTTKYIPANSELLWDYGDRSGAEWLKL